MDEKESLMRNCTTSSNSCVWVCFWSLFIASTKPWAPSLLIQHSSSVIVLLCQMLRIVQNVPNRAQISYFAPLCSKVECCTLVVQTLFTVHTVRQLQHSHDTTVSYSQTAFQARVCRQLLIWSRAVSSVPGSQYCCYVTWDSPSQSLVVHQPYNKEDNIREKFNNHHHTNNAWEEEGIQLSR